MSKNKNVSEWVGCVYVVEFGDKVKIGFTTNFENRLKTLQNTLNYSGSGKTLGRRYCTKKHRFANRSEKWLQERFKSHRIDNTELFDISYTTALRAVKQVENMKLYTDEEMEQIKEQNRVACNILDWVWKGCPIPKTEQSNNLINIVNNWASKKGE